jgi:hypothetical protein
MKLTKLQEKIFQLSTKAPACIFINPDLNHSTFQKEQDELRCKYLKERTLTELIHLKEKKNVY